MVLLLQYAIAGIVAVSYVWGIWLCLPFVEIQEGDDGKTYFQQGVMTRRQDGEPHYLPRWYAFPFFLNVTVLAAIAWAAVWLLARFLHW